MKARKSFWGVMKSGWGGIIVISILAVVAICVFPGNNVFTLISVNRDIAQQKEEMKRLESEIRRMEERIETLKTNKDSLERFARENFHMAVPGEDVYLVDE